MSEERSAVSGRGSVPDCSWIKVAEIQPLAVDNEIRTGRKTCLNEAVAFIAQPLINMGGI
jgi:hypothetical protein